ncbi:MAG: LPXTG cell wall anchor domain-containing protein [Prolixibacteraceae bacterium]|jgi:LPXTG-motif cell wall-anchored protein|nr:LPXTG cell wall anchor domain-containing protein [Prolixibacteraceae bacterium]
MKIKKIYLLLFVLALTLNLFAQPLPPTSPSGSPVPIGALAGLLLIVGTVFMVKKKKNK